MPISYRQYKRAVCYWLVKKYKWLPEKARDWVARNREFVQDLYNKNTPSDVTAKLIDDTILVVGD